MSEDLKRDGSEWRKARAEEERADKLATLGRAEGLNLALRFFTILFTLFLPFWLVVVLDSENPEAGWRTVVAFGPVVLLLVLSGAFGIFGQFRCPFCGAWFGRRWFAPDYCHRCGERLL